MVVSLKTSGRPSSQEDVTKHILAGGSDDAKGSLQSKFERCSNTSME